MDSRKLAGFILFISILCISGCSSTLRPVQSGFLGDYSQLKSSKKFDDTQIYRAPQFNKESLAQVTKIHLVPFEIWFKQDSAENVLKINPRKLTQLSQYFHTQMSLKLEKNYEIVDKITNETLIIQGAFSDIKVTTPGISVTDFIPVRVVLNAGNAAYLTMTSQQDVITEVAIEVEFLAGSDNARLFAMTASKQMDLTVAMEDGNTQAVKLVLDTWIDNFVTTLAEVRNQG